MLSVSENELLQRARAIGETSLSTKIKKLHSKSQGYVYFVHAVGSNRYKIGRSSNPPERFQKLASQSPYPLQVIDYFWSPDARLEEKSFHQVFAFSRIHGEWFDFCRLTKEEFELMPNPDAVSRLNEKITHEMRHRYHTSFDYVFEIFCTCRFAIGSISSSLEDIIFAKISSEVKGASFVLKKPELFQKDIDVFNLTVSSYICNAVRGCQGINRLAFVCAFLEINIAELIEYFLAQDASPNSALKMKTAINSSLTTVANFFSGIAVL